MRFKELGYRAKDFLVWLETHELVEQDAKLTDEGLSLPTFQDEGSH